MGGRRRARELALQLLYELDVRGEDDPAATAEAFWARQAVPDEVRVFADTLVRGAKLHKGKIDELIGRFAERWALDRMAVVDSNILRAGVFELLWQTETPPKVVINEALDIARKFSTEASTRFINGMLDRVRREQLS